MSARPESKARGATGEVAIVVASIEARATVVASLGTFLDEVGTAGEVVLVDASRDGTADEVERALPSIRVLRLEPGQLAPALWSAGLRLTETPLVAFSTAQMLARPGWLAALRARLEATGAAAVGGPIAPSDRLSGADRAIYLQRYVNYLPPLTERPDGQVEPPGDNALYRREALAGLETVWERGFWEVEVHRHLRQRGQRLAMASEGIVAFQGGAPLNLALRQRRAHARHYGAARAKRLGRHQRLIRSAAAPMVPALLLRRIAGALAARGENLGRWLPALPPLSLLLAAWSIGELAGTWFGPPTDERMVA